MFPTDPAVAARNFQLALTGIVVISAFLIALVVLLCRRADRKLDALMAELLALPADQLDVWVSSYVSEVDFIEFTEYRLFYRIKGENAVLLASDDWKMKSLCRTFAAAGRPVATAPKRWFS